MRQATASVGLTPPRSISLIMERLTPQAADICSSVQPRFRRNSRTRLHSSRPFGSAAATARRAGVFAGLALNGHGTISSLIPRSSCRPIQYCGIDYSKLEWEYKIAEAISKEKRTAG